MRLKYSSIAWRNVSLRWTASYGMAFWLLVLLAASLRFYALAYGLPCYTRPDEDAIVVQMASLWYTPHAGQIFTRFLFYPTLFAHLLGAYWFPHYLLAKSALPGMTYYGFLNGDLMRPAVQISERMLSALCGVLVCFPLFRLGMTIRGRRTALFVVALWTVAFLPVRDAHFGVTDQLAALATTWALWACIRYHQERTGQAAIVAGACVGWAIASKYVLACGLLLLVAHFWNYPKEQRWGRIARLLALTCVAAVVVLTPEFARRPWEFVHVLGAQRGWNREYAHILPMGWIYFVQFTLRYGLGIPVMLAAAIGGIAAIKQKKRPLQLTLWLCGLYYLFAGAQHGIFSRHLNAILPSFCLLAAYGVSTVYFAVESRLDARSAALVAGVFALLCVGQNLKNSLELLAVLKQEDTRALALRWIRQNVPAGHQMAVCGVCMGYPERLRLQVINDPKALKTTTLNVLRRMGVTYVLTAEYVPQMPYVAPQTLVRELQSDPSCHSVAVFSPYPESVPTSSLIVEFQDAWFLPFANVSSVQRPGPLLTVYRLQ